MPPTLDPQQLQQKSPIGKHRFLKSKQFNQRLVLALMMQLLQPNPQQEDRKC